VWSGVVFQDTRWDARDEVFAEGGTGFAGHSDWRIPNVKELLSIVNYQNFGAAVSAEFNNNCGGNTVLTGSCTDAAPNWTSTTRAHPNPFDNSAWYVDFSGGANLFRIHVAAENKDNGFAVRAVRGGSNLGRSK
jgi:hypothetical protein